MSSTLLGIGGQIVDCLVLIMIVSWNNCADKKNVEKLEKYTFRLQSSFACVVWRRIVRVVAEKVTGKVEDTNDAVASRLIVDPRPRNIGFVK